MKVGREVAQQTKDHLLEAPVFELQPAMEGRGSSVRSLVRGYPLGALDGTGRRHYRLHSSNAGIMEPKQGKTFG